jgi:hypothetical protein
MRSLAGGDEQLPLDLATVRAGLSEQYQDLIVIVPRSAMAETGPAHRVGRVDASVHGEARRGDVASSPEVTGCCLGELRGLCCVGADLSGRHRPGALCSRPH